MERLNYIKNNEINENFGLVKEGAKMAIVQGIETRKFDVEIDKEDALNALAKELHMYNFFRMSHGQYYKVEENKLYSFEDVSYHGSPCYEKTLIAEDTKTIRNYELIKELADLNDINILHY
jgi:hypothetical protein